MRRRIVWSMVRGIVLLCAVVAFADEAGVGSAVVGATDDGAGGETVVAMGDAEEKRLTYEYENAVVRATEGIRALASKNPYCWIAPPDYPKTVAYWDVRTVYMREATYKVPIYEYDTYEALVPGASAGQLVKATRSRIKGIKGYREVTRLVYDKKGPIPRERRFPVYEKGVAPLWRWGLLGVNAMTVYALRVAGVPENDGLIVPTAEGMATFVNAFDMPDGTWDLAWLTAAFSVLPQETYGELAERCASKLMDGQITSGEGAGLWGPVCVNRAVVSAVYKVMVDLSDDKAKVDRAVRAEMQAALKGVKVRKRMSKAESEQIRLEQVLMKIQREGERVTQRGLRMFLAMGTHVNDHWWGAVQVEAADGEKARVQGHPYLIHNQALVDMDSTAVALFALRVAAQQQRLPAQTWRPTLAAAGRTAAARAGMPRPQKAVDVVRLASKAIAGARLPDGRWHATIIQQSMDDFAWLKAVPKVTGRLPALDSLPNALSTLHGLAALNSASFFKKMTPIAAPYDNEIFMKILDEALTWTVPVKGEPAARANVERLVAAGMLCAFAPSTPRPEPSQGWTRAATNVLERQNEKTGLWGQDRRNVIWISSGMWARKVDLPALRSIKMADYYPQAHLAPALTQPRVITQRYALPAWTLSTAGALMFLSDGLSADWTCPTEGVMYEPPPEPEPAP